MRDASHLLPLDPLLRALCRPPFSPQALPALEPRPCIPASEFAPAYPCHAQVRPAGSAPPSPQREGANGKMIIVSARAPFAIANAPPPPPPDSPSSIAAAFAHGSNMDLNLGADAPGRSRISSRGSSLRRPQCAYSQTSPPASASAWFVESESTSGSSVDAEVCTSTLFSPPDLERAVPLHLSLASIPLSPPRLNPSSVVSHQRHLTQLTSL
ncbi:hypothetical protein DFH09DRAFT_1370709 [Mycena vulgaris]|nr:hypothetical protein DFH09DRAFT_1370709 [Mycena vulgaris]